MNQKIIQQIIIAITYFDLSLRLCPKQKEIHVAKTR